MLRIADGGVVDLRVLQPLCELDHDEVEEQSGDDHDQGHDPERETRTNAVTVQADPDQGPSGSGPWFPSTSRA